MEQGRTPSGKWICFLRGFRRRAKGLAETWPLKANRYKEMTAPLADEQFQIRRFSLGGGQEITLYCQLLKFRPGPAATFSLYEDTRGLRWMEISINEQSFLTSLTDTTFEQQVAAELLTLGFNKYSG